MAGGLVGSRGMHDRLQTGGGWATYPTSSVRNLRIELLLENDQIFKLKAGYVSASRASLVACFLFMFLQGFLPVPHSERVQKARHSFRPKFGGLSSSKVELGQKEGKQ